MIDKVLNTIKTNDMFKVGDKVIVAVSGGPDSICLLHVLYSLRESLGITLVVAHVNHCLRGEEADKDEEYVKEFCKARDIKCFIKREDVHRISKERGISCEMAGRDVRYNFFSELLENVKGQKIAIAHNANDQAETVLMRIMRGTGMEGIIGIRAVRDNIFVRPIINITRKEIERYCEENKLQPRIDKTNLENIYARNKVRLELIPYIENNFNPDIIEALNRLSQTIKVDNEYINEIALQTYREYCKRDKNKVIINSEAFSQHEAILTRIIREALKAVRGSLYNLDKNHIYDIINIQKGATGKEIMLPRSLAALNNYGDIELYVANEKDVKDKSKSEYILKINNDNNLIDNRLIVHISIINAKEKSDFNSKDNLVKFFDYDKINGEIKLRYRKNGDKFVPFGMSGSKKLKDLFIDLKIPKDKRDDIPLILFGEEIAWIVGYRISDKFKVDKNTKNILQIKIEREE